MTVLLLPSLAFVAGAMMLAERAGAPVVLNLRFKGDVKRETQFLSQYGQAVCTALAATLIWKLDPQADARPLHASLLLLVAVFATGVIAMLVKRMLGRVRPRREQAGRFLGPCWRHDSHRESFPSSHSACAVAMTVILARLYPPAAPVFWALALITAALRYLLDAHWPSDIIGGIALGYLVADLTWAMGA